jgi:hypothetical protein
MIFRISSGFGGAKLSGRDDKDADPPGKQGGPEKSGLSLERVDFSRKTRDLPGNGFFMQDLLRSGSLHGRDGVFQGVAGMGMIFLFYGQQDFFGVSFDGGLHHFVAEPPFFALAGPF